MVLCIAPPVATPLVIAKACPDVACAACCFPVMVTLFAAEDPMEQSLCKDCFVLLRAEQKGGRGREGGSERISFFKSVSIRRRMD